MPKTTNETTTMEQLVLATRGQQGNPASVQAGGVPSNAIELTLPAANTFIDSESVMVMGRVKCFFISVAGGPASQLTAKFFTGLQKFAGASGATSQLPAQTGGPADQVILNATAVNVGPAGGGTFSDYITPSTTNAQALQWETPWIGVELTPIATGTTRVWVIVSPSS